MMPCRFRRRADRRVVFIGALKSRHSLTQLSTPRACLRHGNPLSALCKLRVSWVYPQRLSQWVWGRAQGLRFKPASHCEKHLTTACRSMPFLLQTPASSRQVCLLTRTLTSSGRSHFSNTLKSTTQLSNCCGEKATRIDCFFPGTLYEYRSSVARDSIAMGDSCHRGRPRSSRAVCVTQEHS